MQEQKDKLIKVISKIVKEHRTHSISQMANEIGLSKSIWSEFENGNKDIVLTTFWRIAEGINIKPSKLIELAEDELGEDFSFLN